MSRDERYLWAKLGDLQMSILIDGVDWGTPGIRWQRTGNPLADRSRQTYADRSAPRTYAFTAKLVGADKDDLLAKLHALELEVGKEANTLLVQPRHASRSSTFIIERNDSHALPFTYTFEEQNVALVPLVLTGEPWAYGQYDLSVVTYSGTPAIMQLGIANGQEPAPLALTAVRAWGGNTGIAQLVMALVGDDDDAAGLIWEAEDMSPYPGGTWTAYHDANCSDAGNNARHRQGEWASLVFPSAPRAGRFRAYARVRRYLSGEGQLAVSLGSQYAAPAWVYAPSDDWQIVDLGELACDGAVCPYIWGRRTSEAGGVALDKVVLAPLDRGGRLAFGCGFNAMKDLGIEQVAADYQDSELTYINATRESGLSYQQGSGLKALGPSPLLVWANNDDGSESNPGVYLARGYTPRFAHWVP